LKDGNMTYRKFSTLASIIAVTLWIGLLSYFGWHADRGVYFTADTMIYALISTVLAFMVWFVILFILHLKYPRKLKKELVKIKADGKDREFVIMKREKR